MSESGNRAKQLRDTWLEENGLDEDYEIKLDSKEAKSLLKLWKAEHPQPSSEGCEDSCYIAIQHQVWRLKKEKAHFDICNKNFNMETSYRYLASPLEQVIMNRDSDQSVLEAVSDKIDGWIANCRYYT